MNQQPLPFETDRAEFECWMRSRNLDHLLETRGSPLDQTTYYLSAGTQHRWTGWRAAMEMIRAGSAATDQGAGHAASIVVTPQILRQEYREAGLLAKALQDALSFIANNGAEYPRVGLVNIARDAMNINKGAAARRVRASILSELAAKLELESHTEMTPAELASRMRKMAEEEMTSLNAELRGRAL